MAEAWLIGDSLRDASQISSIEGLRNEERISHVVACNIGHVYGVGERDRNDCVRIFNRDSSKGIIACLEIEQLVGTEKGIIIVHDYTGGVAPNWREIQDYNRTSIVRFHYNNLECIADSMIEGEEALDVVGRIRPDQCIVALNQAIDVSLGIAYRWQNVGRSSYLRQGDRKEQAKRQKGQDSFVHLVISQDKQPIIYSFVRTNNQPETLRNHWWLTHR